MDATETVAASRAGLHSSPQMNRLETPIERARRGDPDAFRQLFDRYSRPVISFVYDMVGDRALAEDLTQETFVRAYRHLGSLREDAKFSTWLFSIAKNVAREHLRSGERRAGRVELDDEQVMELADEGRTPVEGLLDKELNGVVRRALGALDEDKRLVFTLKIFQQRSYEEISEITGFSIGKLKTDLHRARAEMRRRIGPYVGGEQ
jgi:RNA polymerase sigma-70 factor, ECF subfamily